MGVLNLTPDSFSDGGELLTAGGDVDVARVRAVAARMVDDGASVLDLGAESTRPGAGPVPLAVQRARVLPALAALSGLGAVLSVDTSEPELMRAACEHGAGMINDVRALARPGALAAVAASGAAVVVMHMQREPGTMQQAPAYGDVVADVRAFLAERVAACVGAGIGKTLAHNLALLARLGELATLGVPIAVGLSRKRSIGELTGVGVARDRVAGSVAAAVLAVLGGARLVRVHDVAATTAALKVAWAVRQARQSG
jgi:dihydropteroate synthase